MKTKVSVIIPVYNGSEHLDECIASLIDQSLSDCEFIFINDGSKDNSREIIERYMKNSKKISLINQENLGVSAARNIGLKTAVGEYVGFVDADDFIDKDYFLRMYEAIIASQCDVVVSNIGSLTNNKVSIKNSSFPKNKKLDHHFIRNEILPHFVKTDNMNSVVNKIYRNELIKNNRIEFPLNIALGEDGVFNMHFFKTASSVKFLNYSGYYYRDVEGSATRDIFSKDYFLRVLEVYHDTSAESLLSYLEKEKIKRLKSTKFINNVVSLTYVYLSPHKKMSLWKRYNYVKRMLSNAAIREALFIFSSEKQSELGKYEKFILKMMEKKSTLGIYFAVSYSRFRNR
ncbi:glycosyltransferase family 2 protein [Metabacillus idriensis]|uniref:glycosyltransferase family 2 protein n=1 Tax=Metabacillus idriensis TaxID=324768 RepID=UPI00174BB11B|nr:glycosyltransferase [Metabacillus idriensis]